jgi:hypothetical protein
MVLNQLSHIGAGPSKKSWAASGYNLLGELKLH